jgi:hypothetical protein
MNHRTPVRYATKPDRLDTIEIADERTERTKRDLERNIGAETPGDPGSSGAPHGDGNSVRGRDADLPLNTGINNDG